MGVLSIAQQWVLELCEETLVLTKQNNLLGRGTRKKGGEQVAKVTYQYCLATRLTILGFAMMRLVPGDLCSVILTLGPSWWHTHFSVKMYPARRILGGS